MRPSEGNVHGFMAGEIMRDLLSEIVVYSDSMDANVSTVLFNAVITILRIGTLTLISY